MGKSYSTKALTLATNAMQLIDANITQDLHEYGPKEIPQDKEWQIFKFSQIFNRERKLKAEKRVAFNHGLMTAIAAHFFDGLPSDLDDFVRQAAIDGVAMGKVVIKNYGKVGKKHHREFAIGYEYAEGFLERYL